jgi:hypothetical protein
MPRTSFAQVHAERAFAHAPGAQPRRRFLRVREFAARWAPPWQPREACAWVSALPRACLRISTACWTVRARSRSISTSAWREECCQSGNSAAQPWRCTVSLWWKPSAVSPSPTQAPGRLAGLLRRRQIVVSPALISDRGAVGSTNRRERIAGVMPKGDADGDRHGCLPSSFSTIFDLELS